VIANQEDKIKVLTNKIRDLGGSIPDDAEMANINQKLKNEEEKK
jgi:hypothetical protein